MNGHAEHTEVFTHLDDAIRYWPTAEAGPFDPRRFEDRIRAAMRSIADSGRALGMNTRRLQLWMPLWWREEGGRRVTFGSDAHVADKVGDGLPEATALLEHVGFQPGRRPEDFWTCSRRFIGRGRDELNGTKVRTAWRRFLVFGLAFAMLGAFTAVPALWRASAGEDVDWLPVMGGILDAVSAVPFLRQAVRRRRAQRRLAIDS